MLETSARLLRLLSLLQARREWPGAELAERLGVSTRTIRRDVDRLRELGYPVHTTMGIAGGYRLGAGAALPPLLLDDDEAVAVAVGLRTAAGGTVSGIEENSLRALAKLEQVLPSRLRHRINALHSATVPVPGAGPTVDSAVLSAIAAACRDHERLRFDYLDHEGAASVRVTEPHRMVNWGRRWYLVAWDVERDDWRTFRVDRIRPRVPTGPRFEPREPPEGDVAAYVSRRLSADMWPYRARLVMHAPAERLARWISPADGRLRPIDDQTCELDIGSESLAMLAGFLIMLDVDFVVKDPPELREHLRLLAARTTAAALGPARDTKE
ncbi:helix-turn-helix transcriptional regulator [Spongiactinospora rosea]|uniref:helix-turn-helix transcriptional regulator n=1 Tax=Spongiactinospora rosea TaxID=2248750 RepID=UPI0018F3A031|nr:YafY family protein [Spongiactinospora rosea]